MVLNDGLILGTEMSFSDKKIVWNPNAFFLVWVKGWGVPSLWPTPSSYQTSEP